MSRQQRCHCLSAACTTSTDNKTLGEALWKLTIMPWVFTTTNTNKIPATSTEGGEDVGRVRHPTENTALRLDHFQAHLLKFREVRSHTVLGDEAVVPPIVSFADGGV